jgi:DNA (cytosine-5)-methyltransferase 1
MDVGFAEQVIVHKNSVCREHIASASDVPDFVNLKRLPFEIVLQNDILPVAKRLVELNGWSHHFYLRDIREMIDESFDFPPADVIIGGFPCQDFSHAGKRRGLQSHRGTLYRSYVQVVQRVRPLVFVAENVSGLLTMPGAPIRAIVADFSNAGYDVRYQLVKCEEHGIPQTRHRVVILGVRTDRVGALPSDWHTIDENLVRCPIGAYFRHLLEPEATSDPAQRVYSKAMRRLKGQGQVEVALDAFAPTIRAEHHGNIEFRRIDGGKNGEPAMPERRLTVREAALIQTFPPLCILTEPTTTNGKAYRPIGNAVPPLLGYLIGRKVAQILDVIRPES